MGTVFGEKWYRVIQAYDEFEKSIEVGYQLLLIK